MKFSRKWIQSYIEDQLPESSLIVEQLSKKAFEVEEVTKYVGNVSGQSTEVYEIKILPNRNHDCLGHLGLARELSAIFDLKLKDDALYTWGDINKNQDYKFIQDKFEFQNNGENSKGNESLEKVKQVDLKIESDESVSRFMSMCIEDITVGESPVWLAESLESIGQRSINNIVDITNYVQYSINKPMHAYDAANIVGTLSAVYAKNGDKLITLDEKELNLNKETLVIADISAENNKVTALGLAGIKGGKFSGINLNTKNVILESANFSPELIRKTAQKYNIRTDASKRFENGISDTLVADGLYMTARMIMEIAGNENTKISEVSDTCKKGNKNKINPKIDISVDEINRIAGTNISINESIKILEKLGMKVSVSGENILEVIAPPERLDINMMDDIAEEIVRIYGFDNIQAEKIEINRKGKVNKILAVETLIKNLLINKNFNEICGYSLVESGDIEIAMPLSADKSFLRTDLCHGAKKAYDKNIANSHLFESDLISFFEFGNVFTGDKEERRCVLVRDDGKKKSKYLLELKNVVKEIESLFDITDVSMINKSEKPASVEFSINEIIQKIQSALVVQSAVDIEGKDRIKDLQENFQKIDYKASIDKYKIFSLYPFISRDISIWVPSDVNFESIKQDVENLALNHFLKTYKFDEFTPLDETNINFGKSSIAFRIIFQSHEKTLTDVKVEEEMVKVNKYLSQKSFEVR